MADIQGGLSQYAGGAPNLLVAIQTGAGIAQRNQAQALAQERFNRETGQLAILNAERETKLKEADAERNYKRGILEMEAGQKLKDVSTVESGFRNAMTSLGVELPEDFPIDQETYDRFLKISTEKNPDLQDLLEDMFVKDLGISMENYARKAEGFGLPTGREGQQELEKTIAGEQRKIEATKDVERFKSELGTQESKQKVALAQGIAASERERVKTLISGLALDEDTKNRVLVSMEAGVGPSVEKALFDKGAADNIKFIEKENLATGAIDKVPISIFTDEKTGKLVYQEVEKYKPEQPKAAPSPATKQAPAAVKEEKPVRPPLTKESEAKRTVSFDKTIKRLGQIPTVIGAPPVDEYLQDVIDRNSDADGNLLVSEKEIIADYKNVIRIFRKKSRLGPEVPKPLGKIPEIPTGKGGIPEPEEMKALR